MLQSAQLFNNGPHVPPSTLQTMNALSMQSMGAQIPGSNSSSGVQSQGGIMPVSMNRAAVNGVTSGSIVLPDRIHHASPALEPRRYGCCKAMD